MVSFITNKKWSGHLDDLEYTVPNEQNFGLVPSLSMVSLFTIGHDRGMA